MKKRTLRYFIPLVAVFVLTVGMITTASDLMPLLTAQPAFAATTESGISSLLLSAAKKEGEVNYYTSDELVQAQKLKAVFEKKYSIKVNILRASSSQIYNRLVQEFDNSVNQADTIMITGIDPFIDMKAKGMLQAFTPTSINFYSSPEYYDAEHYWHGVRLALSTINYNTNLLKGDMIPKKWTDLTDPKYKGKVCQGHPRASTTATYIVYNLVKLYGWKYFEDLRKNTVMTQQSCSQPNLISSGERLMIPCDYGTKAAADLQNLPIGSVLPQDGVFVMGSQTSVLAKAPHPNAGKVFLDFLTSTEGQTLYAEAYMLSPLNSPDVKYPADFPDRKSLKLINTNKDEFRKWLPGGIEKFSEIFGG